MQDSYTSLPIFGYKAFSSQSVESNKERCAWIYFSQGQKSSQTLLCHDIQTIIKDIYVILQFTSSL